MPILKPWCTSPVAAPRRPLPYPSSSLSQSLPPAKHRTACRSSTSCELSASVRRHLDDLGVQPDTFQDLDDPQGFRLNAEGALATLAGLTSRQRVRTLLVGHPQLLCVPLGVWLDFLTAYGMSPRDFFSLLGSSPELFTRGSLFNAGNVIAYLQSLGLSPRSVVASVLPRNARVLLRDVQRGLVPLVDSLRRELGLDQARLRDLVCRCPRVLTLDAASELVSRVELLVAAGFEREEAAQLLFNDGALLTGDLASVLAQREAFLCGECGFSRDEALAVLRGCPEALSLSVANLSRKWRFLTERMGGGRQEVLQFPQFLSKNLLLHIGPRFAYVTNRVGPLAWRPSAPRPDATTATTTTTTIRDQDGGSGAPARSSAGRCGASGGDAPPLGLRMLLEGDDAQFLERVWRAAVADGAAAAAAGMDVDGAVLVAAGVHPGHMEWLQADYQDFRADWLEREGARWTGVRSVGVTGSW